MIVTQLIFVCVEKLLGQSHIYLLTGRCTLWITKATCECFKNTYNNQKEECEELWILYLYVH